MRRVLSVYTHSWYRYLISSTSWQRYVLFGSMVAVLCIGWFFIIYCPLEHECQRYEQKLRVLHTQCQACSCALTECNTLEHSINDLHKKLKPYQQLDTCPLILCMDCALKAGLCVHSCTMGHATSHDQQHKELITVEVSGTSKAYLKFLTMFSDTPHIIVYEHMHMEYAQADKIHATAVFGFVMLQ